ncbi:hypothetical protein [Bosea sp. RAC05]|uniref:hypothetical protein n=1 Tax=Bosea sp. RAC05 TaxID=1842539 RepID=UPI00083D5318|nr:hypothetical protein [Bosea sp. RAC05]AOG03035.1 hypothetical protein BSY19_4732 [Bosea sp. RAC05]
MPVKFDHSTFAIQAAEFVAPLRVAKGSTRVPIEDLSADLIAALQRVGWDVDGITVKFRTDGRDGCVFRAVQSISGITEGGPFRLRFGTPQHKRGGTHVLTGLDFATIPPGLQVQYECDGSGPSAYVYVGDNWPADGDEFLSTIKVNSKLNGQPRTYLRYSGQRGGRIPHDDDLGREYAPLPGEPLSLSLSDVENRIRDFVMALIARLDAMPAAAGFDDVDIEGDANLRRLAKVERVPAPVDFPVLYGWIDLDKAYTILGHGEEQGRGPILSGTGLRFVSYGDNVKVPERAHDGFCYAARTWSPRAGHPLVPRDNVAIPVEIRLKWLNDIFVFDGDAYDRATQATHLMLVETGRKAMKQEEYNACVQAHADTMVSAVDYDGSYANPVYLIGREIHSDEAQLLTGRTEVKIDGRHVTTEMVEASSGRSFTLYGPTIFFPDGIQRARRYSAEIDFLFQGAHGRVSASQDDPVGATA